MEPIDHAAVFTTSLPKHLTGNQARSKPPGLWQHIRQAVSQAADRDRPTPHMPAVRGSGAATDSLLSLAVTEIPAKKWTIFVPPSLGKPTMAATQTALKEHVVAGNVPSLASDLLPHIDIWFDPGGVTPVSSLFRQWFGQSAYPIVAVQHTMSLHNLLCDYFFPIISSATYPWDSLVCSTRSSATAVSNLLDQVRETGRKCAGDPSEFAGRIEVIPLPVDTDYFSPGDKQDSRSLLGLDRRAFLILYLGSLSATKADLVPFLVAFKDLIAEGRATKPKWVIAGPSDPRYLAYLKQEIQLMGLAEDIVFRGHVTESEKLHLYRAADVFFSPSDSIQESFGLTPVEAMSCGLPQVVSDWDGYRETVVHGTTGFRIKTLWSACDSELQTSGFCLGSDHDHIALGQSVAIDLREWASVMRDLIESANLRNSMGSRSRSTAVSRYSRRAVAEQHRSLWSELISMHRNARGSFAPDRRTLHTAHYFECFSHYASELVTGSERVRAVRNVRWPERHLRNAADFMNSDSDLIDLEICREIIDNLSASECDVDKLCPQQLNSCLNARYLRHVLWLMKQGLVERVP